jgi:hypothetical protein
VNNVYVHMNRSYGLGLGFKVGSTFVKILRRFARNLKIF